MAEANLRLPAGWKSDTEQSDSFLNRKQRLERRRIELYKTDALTNRSDPLHKSLRDELQNIQRELLGKE